MVKYTQLIESTIGIYYLVKNVAINSKNYQIKL